MVWILVLGWLLFGGPSRRRSSQGAAADRPLTLAERLRPMVEAAIENNLDPAGLAELERLILGYWRRKLGLESLPPAEAAAILRTHEDAGPVVRQLEDWLHKPPGTAGQAINVTELLMPYRDIPADALDTETTLVPSHAGKRV